MKKKQTLVNLYMGSWSVFPAFQLCLVVSKPNPFLIQFFLIHILVDIASSLRMMAFKNFSISPFCFIFQQASIRKKAEKKIGRNVFLVFSSRTPQITLLNAYSWCFSPPHSRQ